MNPVHHGCFTPPAAASRRWVTSRDGVRLNVEMHGPQDTREPTVVLIHGNTCSIPFWAPVIRALRGELRIVLECHTCFDWLMPVMDEFRHRWPEVEVDLVAGFHADPLRLLADGKAVRDIARTFNVHETKR